MNHREFGSSGRQVSEIGLGTWQLGGSEWGRVDDQTAEDVLAAAADAGVTFIDTADIYGLGTSEERIARFLAGRADRDHFFIATKLGRWSDDDWPGHFSLDTFRRFTEDSLRRLGVEALDLTQTHCLPRDQMQQGDLFDWLRTLQQEGKIKAFGASVETMDEAVECFEHEGLASLQIIFNIFRQKPIHTLFDRAKEKGVALIVRLPVASGLLAGRITAESTFDEKDHRHFNRDGQSFNVGETFAGLPMAQGRRIGRPDQTAGALGHDDGPVRAPLGARPRRSQRGDPRRHPTRPGHGQRRRQRPVSPKRRAARDIGQILRGRSRRTYPLGILIRSRTQRRQGLLADEGIHSMSCPKYLDFRRVAHRGAPSENGV